ncbi:hypothetical protein NF556_19785 [Ornithinimicrobium faecis]|uniref:Two component regulator three Y domain-containing protein n=1 Tax=Ornithinimicrobium faecis TaxID=2934158 RepID=A0ABY4YTK1_9MICO|nr:hypothetical protein [Ornithinimicrobium sp. HY1793]USQ79800.1 hypothetical protein NF556_19785 [Ornithinimicrobium sp. HY1793]
MNAPARDYRRFGDVSAEWPSLVAFLNGTWPSGVNSIRLPQDNHLDLYIRGSINAARKQRTTLPVFFTGAVSTRDGNPGPFFSGLRLGTEIADAFVSIADPTMSDNAYLRLAWYTGRAGAALQATIAAVLNAVARRTTQELLMIGGSGGGFAALDAATRLRHPASVLVWNPQTNLLDYSPGPVLDYLKAVLPRTPSDILRMTRSERSAALTCGGITHEITLPTRRLNSRLRRIVYLQNSGDTHVRDHAMPFFARAGFEDLGDGLYGDQADCTALVADMSPGHKPPSPDTIRYVAQALINTRTTGRRVLRNIERDLHEESSAQTPAAPQRRHTLTVAGPGILRAGTSDAGARSYAFHIYRDDARIHETGWLRESSYEFAVTPGRYLVRVYALSPSGTRSAHNTNSLVVPG